MFHFYPLRLRQHIFMVNHQVNSKKYLLKGYRERWSHSVENIKNFIEYIL